MGSSNSSRVGPTTNGKTRTAPGSASVQANGGKIEPTIHVDVVGDYGFKRGANLRDRNVAARRRVHDKSIYASIWQPAPRNGVEPPIGNLDIRRVARFVHTASYEETTQFMS